MGTAKWQESDNKRTAELCFQFILTRYVRTYARISYADAALLDVILEDFKMASWKFAPE